MQLFFRQAPLSQENNIFDEDEEFCCIELDTKVIFVRAFHNESLT